MSLPLGHAQGSFSEGEVGSLQRGAGPQGAASYAVGPLVARSSRGNPQTLSPGSTTDSHLVAGVGGGPSADACAYDPPPDGPRYAACGDAVTVPVARWIGARLREFGGT